MSQNKSNKGYYDKPALRPKTQNQEFYFDAILEPVKENGDDAFVIATGAAGTGKTYVATVLAAQGFNDGEYRNIIIARPTVECGESLGALPGELEEKYEPWTAGIMSILIREIGAQRFKSCFGKTIFFKPLQFMRGDTYDQSIIIIDEAQNLTINQTKMVMTRIGEDSKMIICGDDDQVDFDPRDSGLIWIVDELERQQTTGIEIIRFTGNDNVRSGASKKALKIFSKSMQ